MIKRIYLFLFLGAFASCNNNSENAEDLSGEHPETPQSIDLDINSDNEVDFLVDYKELMTTDIPSSRGSIIGSIRPMNDFKLLYKASIGYLFLQKNDTIQLENQTGMFWYSFSADILSISRKYSSWDKYWTILSKNESDFYLAFKKTVDSSSQIGWLKLQIDTLSGKIILIDKVISESNQLIINN